MKHIIFNDLPCSLHIIPEPELERVTVQIDYTKGDKRRGVGQRFLLSDLRMMPAEAFINTLQEMIEEVTNGNY